MLHNPLFKLGDIVTKKGGSSWTGVICGFYMTSQTPHGYCVNSLLESNSVQIYPEQALEKIPLELLDAVDKMTGAALDFRIARAKLAAGDQQT